MEKTQGDAFPVKACYKYIKWYIYYLLYYSYTFPYNFPKYTFQGQLAKGRGAAVKGSNQKGGSSRYTSQKKFVP